MYTRVKPHFYYINVGWKGVLYTLHRHVILTPYDYFANTYWGVSQYFSASITHFAFPMQCFDNILFCMALFRNQSKPRHLNTIFSWKQYRKLFLYFDLHIEFLLHSCLWKGIKGNSILINYFINSRMHSWKWRLSFFSLRVEFAFFRQFWMEKEFF